MKLKSWRMLQSEFGRAACTLLVVYTSLARCGMQLGLGIQNVGEACEPTELSLCRYNLICLATGTCAPANSIAEEEPCTYISKNYAEYQCAELLYCHNLTQTCTSKKGAGERCDGDQEHYPSIGGECSVGLYCTLSGYCEKLFVAGKGEATNNKLGCKPWLEWDEDDNQCKPGRGGDYECVVVHTSRFDRSAHLSQEAWDEVRFFSQTCDLASTMCINENQEECFIEWLAWAMYDGYDVYKRALLEYDFKKCRTEERTDKETGDKEWRFGPLWYGMSLDDWEIGFLTGWLVCFVLSILMAAVYWRHRKQSIRDGTNF